MSFDDFARQAKVIEGLPEPIAYIVLDHARSLAQGHEEGRDALGRRYVVASPAVLDGSRHEKYAGINILSGDFSRIACRLSAIPVYKREDMPDEWPGAWPTAERAQ